MYIMSQFSQIFEWLDYFLGFKNPGMEPVGMIPLLIRFSHLRLKSVTIGLVYLTLVFFAMYSVISIGDRDLFIFRKLN